MVDNFSLAISHFLLFLLFWRLLDRPDLADPEAKTPDPVKFYSRKVSRFKKTDQSDEDVPQSGDQHGKHG